jgi:hypothetical protein
LCSAVCLAEILALPLVTDIDRHDMDVAYWADESRTDLEHPICFILSSPVSSVW